MRFAWTPARLRGRLEAVSQCGLNGTREQGTVNSAMPTTQAVQLIKPAITVDAVLSPYIYIFYAAFLVAFMFTPIMRSVAIFYNIVDKPDLVRKLHAQPVAYLGGIAVFLGWLAGLAMTQFVSVHQMMPGLDDRLRIPVAVVVAAVIVVVLGLADDVMHISPRTKIAGQFLAGAALLWAGIGTDVLGLFINNLAARMDVKLGLAVPPELVTWVNFIASSALTLGLVVFCCNASNLMDGLDGLCGGVTGIIAMGFVFLSVMVATRGGTYADLPRLAGVINDDGLRVVISLALLGAILGFVPFNFNPASIFMGDAGSMFLGFSIALMMLMMGKLDSKWLLAGLVMFALPVLDTSLAFARRYVAGRRFFSADRHHFHHQLVQRGLSVKKAVLVSYLLTTAFVLFGVMVVFLRARYAVAFYMVLFGSIIVAAYKMGMVHERVVVDKPSDLTLGGSQASSEQTGAEGVIEFSKDTPRGRL